MTPGKYDLTLYEGDSYAWRVRLWADADGLVPIDLTGATVAAQFRDKPNGLVVVDMGAVVRAGHNLLASSDGWRKTCRV